MAWRWTARETSTSPIPGTGASARSIRRGRSPRSRGPGSSASAGDGGQAVEAELRSPYGVAVDSAGNVYIADTWNQRIRKIDSTGTITTIAGTGEFGFSGDGGPAVEAELYSPYGVAVDGAGNLYIADASNNGIRKVDSTGTITTIAGTGELGFSGDGGPAVEAELRNPYGVAVDSAGKRLHRRYLESAHPQDRFDGDDHHDRGDRGVRLQRGTAAQAVEAELRSPYGVGGGQRGKRLHRRYLESAHPQDRFDGDDHHDRGGPASSASAGDGGPAVEAELRNPYDVAVDSAGKRLHHRFQ